jgi:hypothetical protein
MLKIADQIKEAIKTLELSDNEIRLCRKDEGDAVFTKAKNTFVNDDPRVWWLSLAHPYKSYYFEDSKGFERLGEYIPNNEESFWFIPELEEDEIQQVFETTVDTLIKVIGECIGFEYNLVSKNFDWLIVENDHNEILVVTLTDNKSDVALFQ